MSEITIRQVKGSALTQTEMDNNLRRFFNSGSVNPTDGTLSLFTSESSNREKQLEVKPSWVNYHNGDLATVTGSLTVTGDITAQSFNTELVSSSIVYESGSTKFGDDYGDVHSFSGSLEISGSFEVDKPDTTAATFTSGYIILTEVSASLNYADDTAAAAGGVPLGGLYRNGNFIQIRIS